MATLRHIGLVVTDIERSKAFYEKHFGFAVKVEALETGECLDNCLSINAVRVKTTKMIDPCDNVLELLQFISHPMPQEENLRYPLNKIGCTHFALTVPDLSLLYSNLLTEGILFTCAPQTSSDGRVKLAFCRDPDGTFIELVEELV
jgi:catechol 2,3-dioxygenase-like lactoylglutathione lyase family enzyme